MCRGGGHSLHAVLRRWLTLNCPCLISEAKRNRRAVFSFPCLLALPFTSLPLRRWSGSSGTHPTQNGATDYNTVVRFHTLGDSISGGSTLQPSFASGSTARPSASSTRGNHELSSLPTSPYGALTFFITENRSSSLLRHRAVRSEQDGAWDRRRFSATTRGVCFFGGSVFVCPSWVPWLSAKCGA